MAAYNHNRRRRGPVSVLRGARNYYGDLLTTVLQDKETINWTYVNYSLQPVNLIPLARSSSEYRTVRDYFYKTNQGVSQITSIERIQNPFLVFAFLLKKQELALRLGHEPQVLDLFHGTNHSAVINICEANFDWRKHGENMGFKFGRGVSFTRSSKYATHYGDAYHASKVMILAKVLVGKCCRGYEDMVLPRQNCDTSQKKNGDVTVKYEDNEFYPEYKITYHMIN